MQVENYPPMDLDKFAEKLEAHLKAADEWFGKMIFEDIIAEVGDDLDG